MKPNLLTNPLAKPFGLTAVLLLAACATEVRDEMPGQAQALPPVQTQTYLPGGGTPIADAKTFRQLQDEENGQPIGRPRPMAQPRPEPPDQQQLQQQQQPLPRRRGSSSPPPPPIAMQSPPPLPQAGSTQAETDRFHRDLQSPEIDRLRSEDAMGRLDPFQQRELFKKQYDLQQGGPSVLGR